MVRVRFPAAAAIIFSPFFPSFLHMQPPLLFHSNFQSWQMRSLPTLDPYVFFMVLLSTIAKIHFNSFKIFFELLLNSICIYVHANQTHKTRFLIWLLVNFSAFMFI